MEPEARDFDHLHFGADCDRVLSTGKILTIQPLKPLLLHRIRQTSLRGSQQLFVV